MISLSLIHEKICLYFQVDYMYPFKRNKRQHTLYVRQIFHYVSRKVNGYKVSLNDIGSYLSDISEPYTHATVMNSIKKIEDYLTYDKEIQKDIEAILDMLPKKGCLQRLDPNSNNIKK